MNNNTMNEPDICMIVATDKYGGFSKDNEIPWRIPEDFAHFRRITSHTDSPQKQNAVIMGRITFETTGVLKNRINIVLSQYSMHREEKDIGTYYRRNSLKKAVELAKLMECPTVFIIGGERVYSEALETLPVNTIYKTWIDSNYLCDSFFPVLTNTSFKCVEKIYGGKDGMTDYWFETWKRDVENNV